MTASSPRASRTPLASHPMRHNLRSTDHAQLETHFGGVAEMLHCGLHTFQLQQLPCISHKPPNNLVLTSFRRGQALLSWDGSSDRSAANKFRYGICITVQALRGMEQDSRGTEDPEGLFPSCVAFIRWLLCPALDLADHHGSAPGHSTELRLGPEPCTHPGIHDLVRFAGVPNPAWTCAFW